METEKILTWIVGVSSGIILTWIKRFYDDYMEVKSTERKLIDETLKNLLIPLKALRKESVRFYTIFAVEEKSKTEINKWRTLTYLSEENELKICDKAILDEIIDISDKQLNLIESMGAPMTSVQFSDLLGFQGAHIRMLKLCRSGVMKGKPLIAKELVFPREMDGALESEIRRLKEECGKTRPVHFKWNRSFVCTIKSIFDCNVLYYDIFFKNYARKNENADMTSIYERFLDSGMERGGLILDAGCGTGRDTKYFIQRGYRVVSFDASKKMVDICNQYPFSYCMHMRFSQLKSSEEYDGIWACASLLHLDERRFKDAVEKLSRALKINGVMYLSIKSSRSRLDKKKSILKRKFYSLSRELVTEVLEGNSMKIIGDPWENNSVSNSGVVFDNFLAKRIGR
ncbi:MAG: class I SAM-dependent methyltransferase [Nitrospirales bacterium]